MTRGGPSISYLPKYLLSYITMFQICPFSRFSSSIQLRSLALCLWRVEKVSNYDVKLLIVFALQARRIDQYRICTGLKRIIPSSTMRQMLLRLILQFSNPIPRLDLQLLLIASIASARQRTIRMISSKARKCLFILSALRQSYRVQLQQSTYMRMIGAEHSIVFSSNQGQRTFEQVEILQMGGKSILETADECEFVDDEGFGGRVGVGEGKLNDWFLDNHYVVKVVLLLAVDLYLLEQRVLYHRDEVIQLVKLLLEVRRLVPHIMSYYKQKQVQIQDFQQQYLHIFD